MHDRAMRKEGESPQEYAAAILSWIVEKWEVRGEDLRALIEALEWIERG